MFRKLRFLWLFFGVLLVLYLFGIWYFSDHFGFRTFLNQDDVSLSSVDRLISGRMRDVSHRMFTFVRSDGFSEKVLFSDLGIYRSSDLSLSSSVPSPAMWPFSLFRDTYLTVSDHLDCDPKVLKERLQALDCVSTEYTVSPTPAKVVMKNGVVTVVPGTFGTKVDIDRLFSVVCQHILDQDFTVDLVRDSCYESDSIPEHTGLSFPVIALPGSCMVDLGFGVSERIPEEVLQSAVSDGQLSYDTIMAYVKALKQQYDTVGEDRTFRTHNGKSIVLRPSDSDTFLGWDLDSPQTCASICNALISGKTSCPAVWSSFGYSHGEDDFGPAYLELDLSEQHLYFWENGNFAFECPVVTGLDTDQRRTPKGIFRMLDFRTDYLMTGYYGSAHVDWFLRLTPEGVGIHDASWRSDFSPDVYLTDGSHGCINLEPSDMKTLYGILSNRYLAGVPVIIY